MANFQSGTWMCECGYENEPEFDRCLMCSLNRSHAKEIKPPLHQIPNTEGLSLDPSVEPQTAIQSVEQKPVLLDAWRVQDDSQKTGNKSIASNNGTDDINITEVQATPPRKISSNEVKQLIEQILHGNESEISNAIDTLIEVRPIEAILPLVQIAQGNRTKDKKRQDFSIIALGYFGDSSVIPFLTEIKKPPELIPSVCITLGRIKHPSALPYLMNIAENGLSIPFNLSLRVEEEHIIKILAQAYALMALASIGQPQAVASLIKGATKDTFNPIFIDDVSGKSSNFLLFAAETALKSSGIDKKTAVSTSFMVDHSASVETALEFPGEIRKMFMLQCRRRVLGTLYARCGPDPFLSYYLSAKDSIQRLMVALPMLDQGFQDKRWYNCLAESSTSKSKFERILAYDGFIIAASQFDDSRLIEWGRAGLNDNDTSVQLAVAASILFNQVEPLILAAINFKNSSKATSRAAILPPIMYFASYGDERGEKALRELSKDRDKMVRELATDFLQDLPAAKIAMGAFKSDAEELNETFDGIMQNIKEFHQVISDSNENAKEKMAVSESHYKDQTLTSQEPKEEAETDSSSPNWTQFFPSFKETDLSSTNGSNEFVFCENCGNKEQNGTIFCTQCGKAIGDQVQQIDDLVVSHSYANHPSLDNIDEIICPNCGEVIEGDSQFCPNCGKPISELSIEVKPVIIQPNTPGSDGLSDRQSENQEEPEKENGSVNDLLHFQDSSVANPENVSPILNIAFCLHCGHKTLGNEDYCTNCGTRLEM